jgi:hypothetical protein
MTRTIESQPYQLLSYCRGRKVYTGSWRHTKRSVSVRYGGREVHTYTSLYEPGKRKEIAQNLLAEMVEAYEQREISLGCHRSAEISVPAVVRGPRVGPR